MKRGTWILTLALHAGLATGAALAQSGTGGSGGSAGSGTGTAGNTGSSSTGTTGSGATSTSTATSSPTSPSADAAAGITPAGSAIIKGTASKTPDMSTSGRRTLDTANTPGAEGSTAARNALPPGVQVTPSQAGVSPVSGLPTAEIPPTSRATPPVASDGSVQPVDPSTATTASRAPVVPDGADQLAGTTHKRSSRAAVPQTQVDGAATAGPSIYVATPPPARQTEAAPGSSARADQVWVPGHYSWTSGQWTWVAGTWQRPPSAGATWIPGNYDSATHRWTEGRWQPGNRNSEADRAPRRADER